MSTMSVSIKVEVSSKPKTTFTAFLDELSIALRGLGLEFEPTVGVPVRQGHRELGSVISLQQGEHLSLQWFPVDWVPATKFKIDFGFRPTSKGTAVTMSCKGLESVVGEKGELLGWFAGRVIARFLEASTPHSLGDWMTDRRARRPTGEDARRTYRNPTHHRPNFGAILNELSLSPNDQLLEIGCGGGAFLKDALKSGCSAKAIDHSFEMVRLAKRVNSGAIKDGRLDIRESEADSLPFGDSTFTCAVMTGVLGFLPDATKVFAEVLRVLRPEGRMIVFATNARARGTPAAPEPMASRIHFYEDAELESMAHQAGFETVHVEHPDLSRFVKGSGIPKRDKISFSSPIAQLLIASKR